MPISFSTKPVFQYTREHGDITARDFEEVVEKLASSLVDARLTKKADLFLRDVLKVFPNNTHLNSLMGYNLLSLNFHKEGLGFLKKGTGFIEFNNDSVKII